MHGQCVQNDHSSVEMSIIVNDRCYNGPGGRHHRRCPLSATLRRRTTCRSTRVAGSRKPRSTCSALFGHATGSTSQTSKLTVLKCCDELVFLSVISVSSHFDSCDAVPTTRFLRWLCQRLGHLQTIANSCLFSQ